MQAIRCWMQPPKGQGGGDHALYQAFEPDLLELKQDLDRLSQPLARRIFSVHERAKSGDGKNPVAHCSSCGCSAVRFVLSAYVALTRFHALWSQLALSLAVTEHQCDDVIPATDRRDEGQHHGPVLQSSRTMEAQMAHGAN